uniref:asparagine synthase (glutamine-hydrolyzing) n=1 Tax=Candidatus Kentrum sp. LFY TaxID=2126342 RepID=A0A450WFN6_9GAMM|nr:MAG: asparagine synthase (glutamine-hydrolysing) [Candidatus Kentron sp. LFY]
MCGISGIIDYEKPMDRDTLEQMQAALRHRGPDGRGLRILAHGGLAHTRLSILDPARGSQPLCSPDARYWIVYNGEVYNFRELRRDLRDSWDFETDCDTEVVLAAWVQWGRRCLTRLNGMFAFFVWDTREEKGWLVRDLLGIKPVAWTNKGNFRFASEARVLAITQGSATPSITQGAATPSITQGSAIRGDKLSILEYFVAPYCSGITHSMFADIHYLQPGQYLQVSREGVTSEFWADYNPHPVANSPPPDLRPFLENAVQMSMVSDVPVGYLLSGGIDSALVTHLGYRHTGRGNAYTIDIHGRDRFAEDRESLWAVADDVPYAVRTARALGVPHHLVPIDRLRDSRHIEEVALANELIPVLEEETALHRLYERAARDQKTIAVGEVADETHYGYYFLLNRKTSASMRNIMDALFYHSIVRSTEIRNPVEYFAGKYEKRVQQGGYEFGKSRAENMLAASYFWIKFILPRLLHNNDLHSMHFSLEVRVPFADVELLDAAAQVHPSIAFRDEGAAFNGNRVKRWLRHCTKGLLPEEIRLRRKSGTPFPRYVSGIYKRELRAILRRGGEEFYEEFLDVPRLAALCDETLDENQTAFLFRCIAFYYWVKHHRITGFA